MSADLSDAEVARRFAEQLRPLTVAPARARWVWEWVKATVGWLWHSMCRWSPAKGAMAMTGLMVVFVTVLVMAGEWRKVFILTVAYVLLGGMLMLFALLESERPNGRAGMIKWSNDRTNWPR